MKLCKKISAVDCLNQLTMTVKITDEDKFKFKIFLLKCCLWLIRVFCSPVNVNLIEEGAGELQEGMVKKGGLNIQPSTARPSEPPKPQP